MTVVVVAEVVAVTALAVLVAGVLRGHADVLEALDGLERLTTRPEAAGRRGASEHPHGRRPARDVGGTTVGGEAAHVAVASGGELALLMFLVPSNEACAGFWEALSDRSGVVVRGHRLRLVILLQDPAGPDVSDVRRVAPAQLPVLYSSDAWHDYGVVRAPYFVLVDGAGGTILGEGTSPTWEGLIRLLSQALADSELDSGPRRTRREFLSGRVREADTDAALQAAGIVPGDPRLYPETLHGSSQGG